MEKVRSCMINIISKRELSNSVIYELDDNILRSNIISILKMFENGESEKLYDKYYIKKRVIK